MKKITLAVMAALFALGVVASTASATPAQVKPRASAITEIATEKKAPAKKKTAKKKATKKTAKKAGKPAAS